MAVRDTREEEATKAIAASFSYAEALRRLGMRAVGGNFATIKKYAEVIWQIPTDHFDSERGRDRPFPRHRVPLESVLVEGSTFSRGSLKLRLFREGLKAPVCELCGQGEIWRDRRLSLILDHANGVSDDNRIENLRIVCPNCAATLDTHCGRQNRLRREPSHCLRCGKEFRPETATQRYCSRYCGVRATGYGRPMPERRKVQRPPYTHLLREVSAMGYLATGRRYGVSDNAIRKWLRQYEHERATASADGDPRDPTLANRLGQRRGEATPRENRSSLAPGLESYP